MTPEHDEETPERDEDAPASGFPEPPAEDEPGDRSHDRTPHSSLSNPVDEPDPTEWPDPYEQRKDPRGGGEERPTPGSTSTSEPHPSQDPEAEPAKAPERDKLDD